MVSPCGIDAMLITDHFPELQTQNGRYHMTVTCNESTHLPIRCAVHGIGGWGWKWGKQQWVCIFVFWWKWQDFSIFQRAISEPIPNNAAFEISVSVEWWLSRMRFFHNNAKEGGTKALQIRLRANLQIKSICSQTTLKILTPFRSEFMSCSLFKDYIQIF